MVFKNRCGMLTNPQWKPHLSFSLNKNMTVFYFGPAEMYLLPFHAYDSHSTIAIFGVVPHNKMFRPNTLEPEGNILQAGEVRSQGMGGNETFLVVTGMMRLI